MGIREEYQPVPQAEDVEVATDVWAPKKPALQLKKRIVFIGVASALVLGSIAYSFHHRDWPYDVIDTVTNHTQSWDHVWDSITDSIAGSPASSSSTPGPPPPTNSQEELITHEDALAHQELPTHHDEASSQQELPTLEDAPSQQDSPTHEAEAFQQELPAPEDEPSEQEVPSQDQSHPKEEPISWMDRPGPGLEALPDPYLFGDLFDELKPASQQRYVTAVPLGGISNQMTGVLNLIVLGVRTNRAVILPPISPNLHQLRNRRGPSYDLFYDIPNLSNQLDQLPLLDWNKLRKTVPYHIDQPGWEWLDTPNWKLGSQPLPCYISASMGDHGGDLSWGFQSSLAVAIEPQYAPNDPQDGAWKSMGVAQRLASQNTSQVQINGVDKDVACFTSSYWMNGAKESGRAILGKMKFSAALEAYADKTIAASFGIKLSELPDTKFLTVHLRRNDVYQKCDPNPNDANVTAPASAPQAQSNKQKVTSSNKNQSHKSAKPKHAKHRRSSPHDDLDYDANQFVDFEFGLDPSDFFLSAYDSDNEQQRIQRRKAPWQFCHFTDEYVVDRVNQIRREKFRDESMRVLLATDDTNQTSLDFFKSQKNWFTIQRIPRESDARSKSEGHVAAGGEEPDDFSDYWEVMVDTAILTKGSGFLGTKVSTLSRTASQRGAMWYKRPSFWLGQ